MAASTQYLVVIDPTKKPQPALLRAGWLAGQTGSSLHLYLCAYNQALSGDVFFDSDRLAKSRKSYLEHSGQWLDELAAPYRDAGVAVTTEVVWGKHYHRTMLTAIEQRKPELVIKETVHHNKLKRVLFSSSDWALIRECPEKVLLVRAGDWPDKPVIVAAVDPFNDDDKPAALDDEIVRQSLQFATITSGSVRLAHAWQPVLPAAVAPIPVAIPDGIDNQEIREQRRLGVEALARKHAVDNASIAMCEGDIAHALPQYVDEVNASMVVMGAVSRNRMERLVIGSTAERVLDRLTSDILIVRPV